MPDDAIEVSYRTTVEVPRAGIVGSLLRWLGGHPIWGGFICGVVVVLIAAVRQPGGIAAAPLVAAAISSAVVVVWMILFYLMRRFFDEQSYTAREVVRQIVIGDDEAAWLQDDEPQRQIDHPRLRILTNPVPDSIRTTEDDSSPTAWPVWIVIDSEDSHEEPLIFETREPAGRVEYYDEIPGHLLEHVDERLPRAIASPLLQRFGASTT